MSNYIHHTIYLNFFYIKHIEKYPKILWGVYPFFQINISKKRYWKIPYSFAMLTHPFSFHFIQLNGLLTIHSLRSFIHLVLTIVQLNEYYLLAHYHSLIRLVSLRLRLHSTNWVFLIHSTFGFVHSFI